VIINLIGAITPNTMDYGVVSSFALIRFVNYIIKLFKC